MVGSVIWPWEKASAPNRTGTRTPSMTWNWPSIPTRAVAMRMPFEPTSMAAMFCMLRTTVFLRMCR